MTNKKLGSAFEREMCEILAQHGYWVHFIVPDIRGAQPFDIIAVKDGIALALDCKTSVSHKISLSRLEENQKLAFERWMNCGNSIPIIAVKYGGEIFFIPYDLLKRQGGVDLNDYPSI